MRKICMFGLVAIFLSICSIAIAAPVGNIATPAVLKSMGLNTDGDDSLGIYAAFEADLTTDRKFETSGDVTSSGTEISWYGDKVGVSVTDKVFFYGLFGSVSAEESGTVLGSSVTYKTDDTAYWGLGASVIVYETEVSGFGDGTLRLGGDLKYRTADPDVDEITIDGTVYTRSTWEADGITNVGFEYGEFQGALEASYQLDKFIPYFGIKFTNVDGEVKATLDGTEYKDGFDVDGTVGMFLGADLLIADSWSINVEGRFIDEEAVNFGTTIRF